MSDGTRVIDWQEVHARLERIRKAIQIDDEPTQEETARVLKSRALALATPPEDTTPATKMLQLLVFSLSGERFGVETAHVLEVVPLRELIPVPCTPAFVFGVTHYRGRILTVLDLQQPLNLLGKDEEAAEGKRVISVEVGGMTFGIVADTVVGTLSVPAHKVGPPSAILSGLSLAITRGVTDEFMTILDLDALSRASEILVNDTVK